MVLIEPEFIVNESQCTSPNLSLFAVFDGHGGKRCAEYCSINYKNILKKHLINNNNILNALKDSISETDKLVMEHAEDGSGSTCTLLLIDRNTCELWVINIGDSRCIKISDNNGNDDIDMIEELSIVHKPDDEEEKNRIEAGNGWVTFGRVMGILAVSRALGDKDFKIDLDNLVVSTPSIKYHKLTCLFIDFLSFIFYVFILAPNLFFLLCEQSLIMLETLFFFLFFFCSRVVD